MKRIVCLGGGPAGLYSAILFKKALPHARVEVHERSARCRFKDCRHMAEPGCAVRNAVVQGAIAPRRYESYRRLFRLYQTLIS